MRYRIDIYSIVSCDETGLISNIEHFADLDRAETAFCEYLFRQQGITELRKVASILSDGYFVFDDGSSISLTTSKTNFTINRRELLKKLNEKKIKKNKTTVTKHL